MNVVHPIETHDSGIVNDNMGVMVGGEEPDEGYNRRILPPKNERSHKRHSESQTQRQRAHRCSKCHEWAIIRTPTRMQERTFMMTVLVMLLVRMIC